MRGTRGRRATGGLSRPGLYVSVGTASQSLPRPQSQLSARWRCQAIWCASASCSSFELAVDGAEGREVAAQRSRQQTLLEAAHRGRADELVERLPRRPAARPRRPPAARAVGHASARAAPSRARARSPRPGGGPRPSRSCLEQRRRVERPVVRRQLGELERPEQHSEPLAGPDRVDEARSSSPARAAAPAPRASRSESASERSATSFRLRSLTRAIA